MPKRFADLHIHTTFSDGTFSPKEIIEQAALNKLSAIAITDHDCVDAIEEALKIGSSYGIEIIPAVELSSEYRDYEVHILGYFIDYRNKNFLEELDRMCQLRRERVVKMVEKLKLYNIDIDIRRIFELSGCGSVGRFHIAQAIAEKGYVSDIKEAFRKYIGDNSPCYISTFKLSPKQVVEMINKAGGIAIFAHPATLRCNELLFNLIEDGLRGIEVYHPDHTQSDIVDYLKLATKHRLFVTGGSDFHGFRKEGVSLGSIKIPYELLERLKDARQT